MQGSNSDNNDKTRFDVTSQMSSINQSLLDDQPSIAISQAMIDIDRNSSSNMEDDNSRSIKEAIIDLYLAIKIRSTEELDRINDGNLQNEKAKLMNNTDCFQILEYIRSSIEIIMNLKIEDLEKNDRAK
jgi:hypothetical protein